MLDMLCIYGSAVADSCSVLISPALFCCWLGGGPFHHLCQDHQKTDRLGSESRSRATFVL